MRRQTLIFSLALVLLFLGSPASAGTPDIQARITGLDLLRLSSVPESGFDSGFFDCSPHSRIGIQFFIASGCILGCASEASTISACDDRGTDLMGGAPEWDRWKTPWIPSSWRWSLDGRVLQVCFNLRNFMARDAVSLTASGTMALSVGRDMRTFVVRNLRPDQQYRVEPTQDGFEFVSKDERLRASLDDAVTLKPVPAEIADAGRFQGQSHRLEVKWNPACVGFAEGRVFDGDFQELPTTWGGASLSPHERGMSFNVWSQTPVVSLMFRVPSRVAVEMVPFSVTTCLGIGGTAVPPQP